MIITDITGRRGFSWFCKMDTGCPNTQKCSMENRCLKIQTEQCLATYMAMPCPCGHQHCKNWLVEPPAAIQGVSFTEKQAKAVADLLNKMGHDL